ncbi:2Fe-2S iron-sulfur cluster-binding protein [Gilvimarinus chinensis]|uniref:2Fe-2S iron-sulfur cluster-binding protein n=1 Tax=Gilvimarinus chinensis TaxID=396005 RepID=UPI00036EEDAE|nr:2Fe-2S iron-sulfur cluster-binding protein [Gilvimarinus chinensis]
MVKLVVDKQIIEANSGSSLLDTLLDNGFQVPYSCRAGVCQSCLVQLTEGSPPGETQAGLSDSQKSKQLMMSCQCRLHSDMAIQLYDPRAEQQLAQVSSLELLSPEVFELSLRCELPFRAGQHITLWRDHQTARCYSIASLPADGHISVHVKRHPNGRFSQWALENLTPGSTIGLTGPSGDCYYHNDAPEQPLLFAATGTGIAPLYGIVRDALSQQHQGEITILYCGRRADSLYLKTTLQTLALRHSNITLKCLAQNNESTADVNQADAYDHIKNLSENLGHHRIYLCGAPSFVQKMRKQCFLKGAKPRAVHFDAFEAAQ